MEDAAETSIFFQQNVS